VSGDVHAGFCERRRVRLPPATLHVVGFEHGSDAQRFWAELRDRLAKFSLELNAEKMRLVHFGRFAAQQRAELIEPRVARVVVSNPQKTRAIAEAKVKTDKVDAEVLAQLLAADYLPSVWVADQATQFSLRRQVSRRAHIVRQRTRLKNRCSRFFTAT
jgi:Transposase